MLTARELTDEVQLLSVPRAIGAMKRLNFSEAEVLTSVYARVRQMSATKTMFLYQLTNIVGVEVLIRNPGITFDAVRWKGHDIFISQPEDVDNKHKFFKIVGYYQANI